MNRSEKRWICGLIGEIEQGTTGAIRVHIATSAPRGGALANAARAFHRLGMDRTRDRNGVLIYVCAKSREIALIGDHAAHDKIGEAGWRSLVEALHADFGKGDCYLGLRKALEAVGALLKTHFPAASPVDGG